MNGVWWVPRRCNDQFSEKFKKRWFAISGQLISFYSCLLSGNYESDSSQFADDCPFRFLKPSFFHSLHALPDPGKNYVDYAAASLQNKLLFNFVLANIIFPPFFLKFLLKNWKRCEIFELKLLSFNLYPIFVRIIFQSELWFSSYNFFPPLCCIDGF